MADARRDSRMTQDQLCGRVADVTCGKWVPTRKDIYRIESGTRLVSDLELIAIAASLKREAAWLLFGETGITEAVEAGIFHE